MNLNNYYPTNIILRAALKSVVFAILVGAGIFCSATSYGLLKVLVQATNNGIEIEILELTTHSATMLIFLLLAGLSFYLAKVSIR